MKWTDTFEIAMALADRFPDTDPQYVNFVDLHRWVCELEDFEDEPNRSGEKILEAIQMAWIEEAAD
ncbi:MAG: Fe-S cluster assembly protein IscX [Proteobacteria bacterium]|jgi:FeS assembly protein IscX|nr:Fe-S cluster assembly protein IscX [Pseudomonadota bacterium]MDA0929080.1 Fe-S cluster assembly protein IscX [Pseudomonadota bacterium]